MDTLVLYLFKYYFLGGGTLHKKEACLKGQSSIRSSIHFSLIVKSRSNLFLEPTCTKQLG